MESTTGGHQDNAEVSRNVRSNIFSPVILLPVLSGISSVFCVEESLTAIWMAFNSRGMASEAVFLNPTFWISWSQLVLLVLCDVSKRLACSICTLFSNPLFSRIQTFATTLQESLEALPGSHSQTNLTTLVLRAGTLR